MVNSGVSILRSLVCTGGSAKPSPPGSAPTLMPTRPANLPKSLL
jgi:hypothetical protein